MSFRLQKVNQLIKKELSRIILRQADFPEKVLVTLTRVDASPDLKQAKVYVSVIPEEKSRQVMEHLSQSIYPIQQKLNQRLKMRVIPKIRFVKEEKTAEAGRVEEILEKIRQ